MEIQNLKDEIDGCITSELKSEHLDKQKEEFRKQDNCELAYSCGGRITVEGPRFNFKDEMYRAQDAEDKADDEIIRLKDETFAQRDEIQKLKRKLKKFKSIKIDQQIVQGERDRAEAEIIEKVKEINKLHEQITKLKKRK